MITDRTQADVDNALEIRENKVKALKALTEDDVNTLERGMITINTLNRIEEKQAEIKNLINGVGYWNTPIETKTDWTTDDIFYKQDFQQIIDNEKALRNAFFTYTNTPNTPEISFHYESLNALEKILVDLEKMIDEVKSHYKECGTFECGKEW